ncbi:CheR family methyltransferase [Flavobacterium frigoris]|uniref:Two-component system, chemotaxis family, CheB/CheR fusion protein n=1 Tax=Flavobacterium frigoris TaxID=229204 RepID=A0A1H9IL44_FLAFI|nr:CheR family methyltransferase [Flavobacterium frigoris]SEQ75304.1 two-component system, chemotaxis family, CheB/CheR fusion protein [Flavobacterium frigoris]
MPLNATEAVLVDIVAPVEELPAKLITLLQHTLEIQKDSDINVKNRSSLQKIIILLREHTGHDFLLYKKTTLMRRIERRKGVHQLGSTEDYVHFLQENPKEIELLFKELLIGVTSFFRDTAVWDELTSTILPELIKDLPEGYVLRAWITACSTGEEAYSLAIAFKEVMESTVKHRNITLQIFATDLDTDAIEKARRGFFTTNIIVDVSPERISKFFNVEVDGYRVISAIREMLVFAPHNVIKDPPFTKLNILMCRNMLIYMEPPLQKKLIELFNYSLLPGGIMVLGSAEAIARNNEGFKVLDGKLKLYKRTKIALTSELTGFPSSFSSNKTITKEMTNTPKVVENIQSLADQILLQQFAPASVLVNDRGDILYITGRTGKYLEPVAGKANWNIHVMAREGLRNELPNAFQKALESTEAINLRNIKIRNSSGDFNYVTITIKRIENPDQLKGMVMIVFKDEHEIVDPLLSKQKTTKSNLSSRHKELEAELKQSNEDLLTSREQMQASQEELKSINEELQSTNEELQSTNEELTTSKEEMQSLNEELQTVNAELQNKLSDFELANNDMKNLLNSTEIATLFLDKELNIRRFTDAVSKIFKIRSNDSGRPFTDLVNDLNYPSMDNDARSVIKNLTPIQNTIGTKDGRWYNVRIMPYRTLDDRIDGIVITFTDITASKKAEEALLMENRYRRLFESAKDGILILNEETGNIMDVNPYLIEMLGYSYEQFVEKAIWEIGPFKDIVANKEKFSELKKKKFVRYENLPLQTAKGKEIKVEFVSTSYLVNNKKVIQCIIRDITERKQIEEALALVETRYHHLFESAKEGIFYIDALTGKITDVNPFLTQLLGHSKEEFVNKPIWEINFLKNIISNKDMFKELKQEKPVNYEKVQIETATGKKINVDFTLNMYIVDNHEVMQCFIRNFTFLNSK